MADLEPVDFFADPADLLFAVPLLAVVLADEAPSLLFPLLLALDLALVFPALVALTAADLDAFLLLLEDELLPDLDFPPAVLGEDERDADFADFEAPDELAPDRLFVEAEEVDLVFVDFDADGFFADDAEEAFDGALAAPELFLAEEDPLAVFPTVLTTAFAVPTAAPVAAPCRISPTTSFALSYIASRVPLPLARVDFLPPDDFDAVVFFERLFGIARLLIVFLRKALSNSTELSPNELRSSRSQSGTVSI